MPAEETTALLESGHDAQPVAAAEQQQRSFNSRRVVLAISLLAVAAVAGVAAFARDRSDPAGVDVTGPQAQPATLQAHAKKTNAEVLHVHTFNEDYPNPLSAHTLSSYGVDAVVEPHRITHFEVGVSSVRKGHAYEWTLTNPTTGIHEKFAGPIMTYQFGKEHLGQTFTLKAVEVDASGNQTRTQSLTDVLVKYVRREIRQMTDSDRNRFLDAMVIMYNTPLEEGKRRFGNQFMDQGYLASVHNSDKFGYHGGDVFLTAHPAFQLMLENSLRAIDPNITSSPYWDFMIDAKEYEHNWLTESPVYRDDWFGPVNTTAEDDWQVTTGRWAYTRMPTHKPDYPFSESEYNSYGMIHAPCDNTKSKYLQRSNKYCGMTATQYPNDPSVMVHCFFNHSDLTAFRSCLETNVHGNLHAVHGGAWECAHDYEFLRQEKPDWYPEDVLQFFSPQLFNLWFSWGLKQNTNGLFSCTQRTDEGWPCSFKDTECAAATTLVNVSALNDTEMWSEWGNTFLWELSMSYHGGAFIETITHEHKELYETGAEYRWKHLSAKDQTRFTRWLVEFASQPGQVAVASTGASPADPLFWLWHPIFDRMLHVLRTNSVFDYYDLSWSCDTDECSGNNGRKWLDHLPVEDCFLNAPKGVHFTNKAVWELLSPTSNHIPYVYDDLTAWGGEYWNPSDRFSA